MRTVSFLTLGCKVNQYDTQAMLEGFLRQGYTLRNFDDVCDVYVINTCAVTRTGENKSRKAIRQAARRNPAAAIVAAGCLTQNDSEYVAKLPGVRLVIGTQRRANAAELLEKALAEGITVRDVGGFDEAVFEETPVTANEGKTRAVIKIQDGCENRCAYCIIPDVRGPIRSRPLEAVRREVKRLSEMGYHEFVLTGINLCSYGRDTGHTLMDALYVCAQAAPNARLRLGSLDPKWITPDIAGQLALIQGLCRHFHLSVQSGSDEILSKMRRGYTAQTLENIAGYLRDTMPGCALTADVITGFPGEDETLFHETYAFCSRVKFARMHVFPYSERAGTPAAEMPGTVPQGERRERARRLIALGDSMEREYAASLVGKTLEVLFEDDGEGISREYTRVRANGGKAGEICVVNIDGYANGLLTGKITK